MEQKCYESIKVLKAIKDRDLKQCENVDDEQLQRDCRLAVRVAIKELFQLNRKDFVLPPFEKTPIFWGIPLSKTSDQNGYDYY